LLQLVIFGSPAIVGEAQVPATVDEAELVDADEDDPDDPDEEDDEAELVEALEPATADGAVGSRRLLVL
jgi:hypothetical protein